MKPKGVFVGSASDEETGLRMWAISGLHNARGNVSESVGRKPRPNKVFQQTGLAHRNSLF